LAEFPWPAKTLDCGAHCAVEMSSRKLFFSAARSRHDQQMAITHPYPAGLTLATIL
jgi:hypothetical protein